MNRCYHHTVIGMLFLATPGFAAEQAVTPQTGDRNARANAAATRLAPAALQIASIRRMMDQVISVVDFQNLSARGALEWWSQTANIPLVVHWPAFEDEGLDPKSEITLRLADVPANVLLKLVMQQWAPETRFVIEQTPWFVEVMTRQQAIRNPVRRVYHIGGLLHRMPNFNDAPRFDLSNVLSNTNSGGGQDNRRGSGGGGGLFFSDNNRERTEQPSRTDRAGDIAQVIRDTIEPDIWQNNGGQFCSIRYFEGHLIIKAPLYVHRHIGMPAAQPRSRSHVGLRSTGVRRGPSLRSANGQRVQEPRIRRNVSGVGSSTPNRTSGVAGD